MNTEWLKNSTGDKFFPVGNASSTLYGEDGDTVKDKLDTLNTNITNITNGTTQVGNSAKLNNKSESELNVASATNASKLGNQLPSYFASASSLSLNGYGTESGGQNLWDEKWEVGGIAWDTGETYANPSRIRSIGYVAIKPSTTYFATKNGIAVVFYDSNKAFVSAKTGLQGSFNSPSNAYYLKVADTSTSVYLNDIAIIEGTSGTYSPYFSSNKSLTDRIDRDYELERFGYVCPIINGVRNFVDSNGVLHRRIARVDLGSMSWTYESSNSRFRASVSSLGVGGEKYATNFYKNATVSGYTNSNSTSNKTFFILATNNNVYFYDSTYTTAETFATEISGKYLYFELATEETYSAYDTPSVQSMISDEWQSGTTYAVGSYCIDENVLYKCLVQNSGQNPASSPTYWQKCKVTDVDRVALQTSTQTSFAELARSVPEGYKYSMQLNITNFTDKPSGITSWFAYCDISASNMSGFVSLILTSNQGMWYGKYGSGTVTWAKVVD